MMRIIVCGSHKRGDRVAVFDALDRLHATRGIDFLAQGGAAFIDTFAKEWAIKNHIPTREFKADWTRHGKRAGPLRNRQMLHDSRPDGIVAFPGDNGTSDMVDIAKKEGLKVWFPFGRDSVRRRST